MAGKLRQLELEAVVTSHAQGESREQWIPTRAQFSVCIYAVGEPLPKEVF